QARVGQRVDDVHDSHGAFLQPAFSEQTQRSHTGFAPIRSDRRNAGRSRVTIVSSGAVRTFPMTSWKKHGRTDPSASITMETQGALHDTPGNAASPLTAA